MNKGVISIQRYILLNYWHNLDFKVVLQYVFNLHNTFIIDASDWTRNDRLNQQMNHCFCSFYFNNAKGFICNFVYTRSNFCNEHKKMPNDAIRIQIGNQKRKKIIGYCRKWRGHSTVTYRFFKCQYNVEHVTIELCSIRVFCCCNELTTVNFSNQNTLTHVRVNELNL